MPTAVFQKLLIANRGEIAVRIARTASDLGISTVAIFSEDDSASGHLRNMDKAYPLKGSGPAAYLDIDQIIRIATDQNCDAIHPGYGFLSESAEFAQRCKEAGITFVGPDAKTIALLGDKARAKQLATDCGVPVNQGSESAVTLEGAKTYFRSLDSTQAMIIKAVAGGGGKGMRIVRSLEELEKSFFRCQTEALKAFGSDAVYVERLIERAKHVEVQIIGDGDQAIHLWDRECSLQRQHQKLIEFAPATNLDEVLRTRILDSAVKLAKACNYTTLGTFEFLVDLDRAGEADEVTFLEANPRLQVEHTVTEEILGLDLVELQLRLAAGQKIRELGLTQATVPQPRGCAVQLRINMESMDPEGRPLPSGGQIAAFNPPSGPGIRLDTFAYQGYKTVASFDSLLAKLIVSSPDSRLENLLARARRAIREFDLQGPQTNLRFLAKLLEHPAIKVGDFTTRFIEEHIAELLPAVENTAADESIGMLPSDHIKIEAPLYGVLSALHVQVGDIVAKGSELALVEAMKLEHEITAPLNGIVTEILASPGDSVEQGKTILILEKSEGLESAKSHGKALDLDLIRDDLKLVQERIAETLDENRPAAVERRRQRGQRTARENIADLCDENSFIEYGQLAVAYLHYRKSDEELRAKTPADGFVAGIGTVNAELFGEEASGVAVGAYDATVMAGTQGHKNHQKSDRLFELAQEHSLPLVLFAEGGGGRPREDPVTIAALQNITFRKLAELSGKVPLIGVVSGRCFAGNAALLGMADVIIATENSNIGMGGPALIEAGGLGNFTPEQIGPIDVQHRNGVVDIRVKDEQEAVEATKKYLSYFQGKLSDWQSHDPRLLRHIVPENRLRAYDVRDAIELIADVDSVMELRTAFGQAYVTAFIRVEGVPIGVIANNPKYNSGAIDSDSADKAARFMRLCDAHGLPILTLIDTPGIMVGPEAEETALVRHSARLFLTAASLHVPIFAIVLRKAYGLGAAAAAGGHFYVPFFTIAWPTGELGGMGLEGGVRLAYKNEMEAIDDPAERQAFFEKRVASRYAKGKASYIASYFELDAVIDPAESRKWIVRGIKTTAGAGIPKSGRAIDSW